MLWFFNLSDQLYLLKVGFFFYNTEGFENDEGQIEKLLVQFKYSVVNFRLIHHIIDQTLRHFLGESLLMQPFLSVLSIFCDFLKRVLG